MWGENKMNLDSNHTNTHIYSVCNECGKSALKLPVNKRKKQFDISTWHNGKCDVCGKDKSVTEARDFMFPDFTGVI